MAETLRTLDRKKPAALAELHPLLRERVLQVIDDTCGRLTPWEGYRGLAAQTAAYGRGTSNARWGQSAHNYKPALACDLVLDPRHVEAAAHPDDERYPWLWDNKTPAAVQAWESLERACEKRGLGRVYLRGRLDLPHVQLPRWRDYLPAK